ncbi:MAG: tripartite tricarboxylate transporter substrate binding protein [Rhizobacter sp.]|nr:tripartite tricarboxylate transporter substrate binding protein [Rhizobacter sp.]
MTTALNRRHLLATLLASAALPRHALAATYPSGPVTIVVPFSAGGQFDSIARQIGKPMAADLGEPVIIENIGGAGGNIAASRVSRAKPDGQTLLMYGGNYAVAKGLYKKLDYDPIEDFQPVSRISIAPHVIMASVKSGITSFAQLQQRAKEGGLSYGSPGIGTSMHLTFEIVQRHFGWNIVHVPYKGGATVMTDLIGGTLDRGIIAVGPALEFIRSGKVVALAVTSKARSPALPKVPALSELGMADLDAGSWAGFAVPKGTPAPVVARLNASVIKALRTPELQKVFEQQSFIATAGTPAEMRAFTEREAQRYAPIIRALNLQGQ